MNYDYFNKPFKRYALQRDKGTGDRLNVRNKRQGRSHSGL